MSAAVVVLVAACGGGEVRGGGASSELGPEDARVTSVPEVARARCGGVAFDPSVLMAAPGVDPLPPGSADAVGPGGRGEAFDAERDWRIVEHDDKQVGLLRSLGAPFDNGPGDVREYQAIALRRMTDNPTVPDGTWMRTSSSTCTPQVVPPEDVGDATLHLADTPDSATTSLDLLVTEGACASGRSAEDRIELLQLVETDEEVRLHVGVRPLDGPQDCPSNPATPVTVELESPVGDRAIMDAGLIPPRELTVAPDPTQVEN